LESRWRLCDGNELPSLGIAAAALAWPRSVHGGATGGGLARCARLSGGAPG
jgi:hypothetical protein